MKLKLLLDLKLKGSKHKETREKISDICLKNGFISGSSDFTPRQGQFLMTKYFEKVKVNFGERLGTKRINCYKIFKNEDEARLWFLEGMWDKVTDCVGVEFKSPEVEKTARSWFLEGVWSQLGSDCSELIIDK